MFRKLIDSGWHVKEMPHGRTPAHNQLPWLPAEIPGHIHLDLMKAGVIPDPFFRMQERDVAWVDRSDWVYETSFHLDTVSHNTYLVFHGIDTVADIELNNVLLGSVDNMHISHEFNVDHCIKAGVGENGDNILRVTIHSALKEGDKRQTEWNESGQDTMPYHWDNWNERSFIRKAQYMYGWDWGPVLISCGIWKPVELIQVEHGRLLDWRYETEFIGNKALVHLDVFVEQITDVLNLDGMKSPLSVNVKINGNVFATADVPSQQGRAKVPLILEIDNPIRWQPNGRGEPHLYPVEISLVAGTVVDRISSDIGLRTIEVIQESEDGGKTFGFKFRVNGSDLFIKGANWIPSYSFPSVEKIGSQIADVKEAGYNMLRIWGGGLYESETFYQLCDKLGILVWQDFAYACSYYPDTGRYAEDAAKEAVQEIRRLRTHPSLAIWCGNNENDTMYAGNWGNLNPPRHIGEKIYHEILPPIVAEEDPGRFYWPSSPFGGDHPGSFESGDTHNWEVWHGSGDWRNYTSKKSRFVSEFGFVGSCSLKAWQCCLTVEDYSATSLPVKWHDKSRKGYDRYLDYIDLYFPRPQSLQDLVYYSQINQAEALKYGVEHYRRIKGYCWGTIFWQLNDCWPVQSWAVIDYLGEHKAAFFASRKFYAPLLVSLTHNESEKRVAAAIVNDYLFPITGVLQLSLQRFDGQIIATAQVSVNADANSAAEAGSLDVSTSEYPKDSSYLYAKFIPDNSSFAATENMIFFVKPKEFVAYSAKISCKIQENDNDFSLVLSSPYLQPYVWLRLSDNQHMEISYNYFHLMANVPVTVTVKKSDVIKSSEYLNEKLMIHSLFNAQARV